MMSYLAKCFEKMCSFLAVLALIAGTGLGIPAAITICNMLYIRGGTEVIILCGCCIFGLLIAFIFDVVVFGFFAQIIQIRKLLEEKK